MAGHVSKEMFKHYSHIPTLAKRNAVDALSSKPKQPIRYPNRVRRTRIQRVYHKISYKSPEFSS
jgi:hypothetical protein